MKGQRSTSHCRFSYWPCRLRGFPFIKPNQLIFGIHTTHERALLHAPFSGWKVKNEGHIGLLKSLSCPLRGFFLILWNQFICGIHTTHDGRCAVCHFKDQRWRSHTTHDMSSRTIFRMKGQGHVGHLKFFRVRSMASFLFDHHWFR